MQIRRIEVDGPDGQYGLSYADWTTPVAGGRPVVCVHGLTRNGRDFDHLARVLAAERRVICPDVVGRGLSDPLTRPEDYALPTYVGHMVQLLQRLGLAEVDWVGTSMGGLIGMGIAAMPAKPDPEARAQRHRAVPAQGRARAHQQLPRPRPAFCQPATRSRRICARSMPASAR